MHPIFIKLGSFTVYSYGAAAAAAVVLAYGFARSRARRFGFSEGDVSDLVLLLFISGVIGARLFYIAQNWDLFAARPLSAFWLREGGLVWYGGFLLALLSGAVYARVRRLSAWALCDLFSPVLAFAHAVGRVGCFLNGCCFGIRAGSPFGVLFEGETASRLPVQLYEAAGLALIGLILLAFERRARRAGSVFAAYLALYGTLRFFLEFLRDGQEHFLGLTVPQWTCLILIAFALLFWKGIGHKNGKT